MSLSQSKNNSAFDEYRERMQERVMRNSVPRTKIGKYLMYYFVPMYGNAIKGLVYFATAFKINLIGLITIGYPIPEFLKGPDGKIYASIILMAILFEVIYLFALGALSFFEGPKIKNV